MSYSTQNPQQLELDKLFPFQLDPFQLEAIDALNAGKSVVVCAPTGSGKTTTLYAVLQLLNHPDVNITTIEYPVEYKVAGVNQIQVNTQTNLSTAKKHFLNLAP